ncbi:DUF4164 domain-containing protein [Mangrovicella endophytica]|uniref:DUF4164 domain-containing protein n=1 Tax=Mangrovicella endophytica TaxID=2066697 RepID=UPI000C9EADA6|nr:DUF4164 domain-containing protein [Mangrovicella endophytica]
MSIQPSLETAKDRLAKAVERLSDAVDARIERESILREGEAEIQRMTADRGRLAGELDSALARSDRLEQANREVSRRLVTAMETVRAVLERHKQG